MTTTTAAKPRSNTYAGICSTCRGPVAAGAGYLGPKVDGRWTVTHTSCVRGTQTPAKKTAGASETPAKKTAGASEAQVNYAMRLIRSAWFDSDLGQGFDAPTRAEVVRMSRREVSALIDDLREGF